VRYDREIAEAVVEGLRERRDAHHGRLPDGELARAAAFLGVPPPSLSRWVTSGVPPERRRMPRYDLQRDDEARVLVYEKNKSRSLAHAELVRLRGEDAPSLRTLQRAFRRMPEGAQAAIEKGDDGWRRHRPAERYEAEFRNQHWQADHQDMEIFVKPPERHEKPVRPWLTIFVDCYSRAIMSYVVSLRPNQGHVLAGLGAAIRRREGHGPFHGVPGWLTLDRGMENVADSVIEAIVMLRMTAMPTLPRHPEHNGKVERLHSTITSMFLADLPGYIGGAKDRDKTLIAGDFVLPLDVFLEELAKWVRFYNCERPHRALDGRTPLDAWKDDPTPISVPPEPMLRRYLLKGETRKVLRGVITFKDRPYVARVLPPYEGRRLEIRYDPNDDFELEVYDGETWIATAVQKDRATATQTDEWVEAHQQIAEQHRRDKAAARKRARRRRKAMVDGSPSVNTTNVPMKTPSAAREKRRREARKRVVDRARQS
jgi:putative transposase